MMAGAVRLKHCPLSFGFDYVSRCRLSTVRHGVLRRGALLFSRSSFGWEYYSTNNSIQLFNHCEEHASKIVRCAPVTPRTDQIDHDLDHLAPQLPQ